MRIKSLTISTLLAFLLLPVSFAVSADYSDAVEVNEQFISAMEQYISELDGAQNGSAVASAFNNYADTIEKLAPQMKAIADKYPELRGSGEVPEVLKPLADRAEQLGGKMAGAMMKVFPYMSDPAVQAAQERMAQAMSQME